MLLPGQGAGLSWVLTAVRGPPASSFPEREPDSGLGRAQPRGAARVQAGAAQVSLTFLIVTEAPVTLPSSALPSQPHVHTHTYLVHTCARTLTFTGPCFQPEPQPPAWAGQRASERVHSQLVAFRQEEGASMCNASWLGVQARGREASRVAEQRPVTCVTCLGVRAPWSAPQPLPSVTGAERPWPCRSGSCSWLVHTQVPRGPATLWGPTPRPNCAPPLPMTCSRQPDACWSPSVHVSPLSHPPGCSRAPGGHPWRPCAQQGTLPVPVVGLGRQRGAERPVPLGSGGLRCATGLTPAPRCWGPAAAAEGGPGSHMVLSGRMRPRPAPGFAGPLHSHQLLLNFSPSGEPSRNL